MVKAVAFGLPCRPFFRQGNLGPQRQALPALSPLRPLFRNHTIFPSNCLQVFPALVGFHDF